MACIGNMPSFKYVTVESLVITYNKTLYPIKTFVTNKKYIVWNIDRPYQLEDTNVRPASSLLEYLIVINDNGKPTIVNHDELLYSFDQTTNGSNLNNSSEYNALKSQVNENTTKFNLISNTVDDMTQIIGSTEELEDGSIIYNLNKVKSDSESYGISISEIQTKIDDKYTEIKPIILNDLVEYLRSVSEYKLSFTNVLEDTLITDEELLLINTSKTNMLDKSTKLQTILSDLKVIVDSINDTEKSQLVVEMKNKLTTLQNALITICDSYLQDSKISGEEKTNIIQKTYELTTYIGTVQNTCSNITVNGQSGVIYSVENELLMLKDKTTNSIKELTRETNGLDETVKNQISEISQMKDSIKLKLEQTDVNNTLDNRLNDYSTTNQMTSAIDLSASGILSTVKDSYLNKEDARNTYATQSDLTQTSKNIVATFSESGGYNLLYNGDFKRKLDFWDTTNSEKIYHLTNLGSPNCIGIRMDGTLGIAIQAIQTVSFTSSLNTLTLSYYTYVDDSDTQSDGTTNPFRKCEVRVEYTDGTYSYHQTDNVTQFKVWEKKTVTIVPQKRIAYVRVSLYNRDTTRKVYYSLVQLEVGNIDTGYTPNPNEIYDGIISLDKNGVTVEMIDGEGSKGSSRVSYEGITTYDNDGNIKSWFSDDNAYIKELNVDIINNPYLLQSKPRVANWYVGQNETGDGTGINTSNKANSIQSVLEYIKNNYGSYIYRQDINIVCDSGVNINENIYVGGWIGSGVVRISFGAASTFIGNIKVEDCTTSVVLDGNRTGWSNNDGCMWYRTEGNTADVALYVRNSNVICRGFRSHRGIGLTTYGNSFVNSDFGSSVMLLNNDFVKYYSICKVTNGSAIFVDSSRGDVAILCENLSNSSLCARSSLPIFNTGKNIEAMYNSTATYDGVAGSNSLWMPKKIETTDPEQPVVPSKSWHWVEKTFYFNLSSTTEGSGTTTSGWSDKWGQGKWGSYKSHRGHAIPTESISSWCNVGSNTRNISMTLTMTRLSTSHGYAGAVPIPKIKQRDGTYWNSGVAFALGDKKTISLSSGIASGLSDGTLSELTMWAGTSTSDYSQYKGVSLKVKCEKYY